MNPSARDETRICIRSETLKSLHWAKQQPFVTNHVESISISWEDGQSECLDYAVSQSVFLRLPQVEYVS